MLLTGKEYASTLTTLLSTARSSIRCTIFAMGPAHARSAQEFSAFHAAMHAAPLRGVRCQAILSSAPDRRNSRGIQRGALDGLVHHGWQLRFALPTQTMHAKLFIIDSAIVLIGSHNLTQSAMLHNIEASLLSAQINDVMQAKYWFDEQWSKSR